MNRRGFFASLAALLIAPKLPVEKVLPLTTGRVTGTFSMDILASSKPSAWPQLWFMVARDDDGVTHWAHMNEDDDPAKDEVSLAGH